MLIRYHDDWDGIVSAALLAHWAREIRFADQITFASINYGRPTPERAADDLAVVDFQYDPAAAFWIDHHRHPFASPDDEVSYRVRAGAGDGVLIWDAEVSNCATLVRDRCFGWGYDSLLETCHQFDTASFASPQEWFEAKLPAIQLMHVIGTLREDDKQYLAAHMLEQPLFYWADRFYGVIQQELQTLRSRLAKLAAVLTCTKGVVWGDLVAHRARRVRFAPEYYFPASTYAVQLVGRPEQCRLALSTNAWRRGSADLAALAQRWGGGGHFNAAGIDCATVEDGRRIAEACIAELTAA